MAKKSARKSKQIQAPVSANLIDVEAVLEKSRICFDDGDFAGALKAVKGAGGERPSGSSKSELAMAQIGAWSAYQSGKYAEADEFLESLGNASGLGAEETVLKSLLHFEFREFEECIRTAEPILMPLADTARSDSREITGKAQLDLISCLAMSYYNIGELASAGNVLEEAIRARDDYDEFYVHLATVKARMGDETGRRKVISDGLVRCGQKADLDKLARELVGDERISLCMIVKNEEKMLAQCLNSVRDLVDEIVIVDTGSTDGTVAIAEKFGARVYHHAWQNDFSLHRNQSLEYATGDWILILDADEELVREDILKLKQASRIPNINVLSLSVHNKHVASGDETSFLPSVRMWRRKLNARYEGIVHNELRLPVEETILRVDARLNHYGYGLDWDQMKRKIERTKTLLLRQLEANPDNYFANFNLAQILRGEHKSPPPEVCQQIVEHAGRAVRNSSPDVPGQRHIHLMALDQMVSALFYLGEYKRAEEIALRALAIDPNYLDPMFQLGHVYAGARDFARAIPAYERYIAAADKYNPGAETTSYILIHSRDQAAAYFSLGLIHEEMQLEDRAETFFKRVLDYKKDHLDVRTHLAMLRYRAGDYEGAEEHAQLRLASDRNDITAHYLLADIKHRQQQPAASRAQCLQVLALDAKHVKALELLITLEREANNSKEALLSVDQVLAIDPTNYGALNSKAEILIGQGQMEKALEIYGRLLASHAGDADLLNNTGNCHFRLENYAEAVRYYAEALAVEPQLVPALRNLGLALFKQGDNANAVVRLANYLDYASDDFDITYLVARLHFELSNYPEALRYVESCVTSYPKSPELIGFLADCYLRLGHIESAKMGYAKALDISPEFTAAREMLAKIEAAEKNCLKADMKAL